MWWISTLALVLIALGVGRGETNASFVAVANTGVELHAHISNVVHHATAECCVIEVGQDIAIDSDLFSPTPIFTRDCVIRGASEEVALKFEELVPMFSAAKNVTVRIENLRIHHKASVSLSAMFLGIVVLSSDAKLVASRVRVGVRERSFELLELDLSLGTLPTGDVALSPRFVNVTQANFDALHLRNVSVVELGKEDFLDWPLQTTCVIDTAADFVHYMQVAQTASKGYPMELVLNRTITVTRDDFDGAFPTVRRKVVVRGARPGTALHVALDLGNVDFIKVQKGGQLVLKDLTFQFFSPRNLQRGDWDQGLPIRFNTSSPSCEIYSINSSWATDCDYVNRLAKHFLYISQGLTKKLKGGRRSVLNLGPGDNSTVEIERAIQSGACFSKVDVTCKVPDRDPMEYATQGYVQRRRAEQKEGSDGAGHKSREKVKVLIVVVVLVGVLAVVTLCAFALKSVNCKRAGRVEREKSSASVTDILHCRTGSMFGYSGGEMPRPRSAATTTDTRTELLDEIKEERRGMGDEILQLKEQVGSGGYGVVHKAIWHGLPVAVKTVVFQDVEGRYSRHKKRVVYEAAISSSISHRNIVQTYHYFFRKLAPEAPSGAPAEVTVGTIDWKMFIIQEFCELGSLLRSVRRGMFVDMDTRAPDFLSIIHLAHDIACGVRHLHAHNIIHGDLTARNVLLKQDHSGIVAKISDFGLSVKLNGRQNHVSNHRAGTPLYMAPELGLDGRLSKKCDVYSFGIILWELFHLSLPTPMAFAKGQSRPRFASSCPMAYVLLCATCLSPNPDHRPDFARLTEILWRMMHLAPTEELLSRFGDEFNLKWMSDLSPWEVLNVLEERLPFVHPVDSIGRAGSPSGSALTDQAPLSSLSVTHHIRIPPSLHPEIYTTPSDAPGGAGEDPETWTAQEKARGSSMDEVTSERSGDLTGEVLQGSITVDWSHTVDTDLVSFGWVKSGGSADPEGKKR
ncbi:hypothetical protein BSKO_07434 [Bryopsis sp. KO-2023]|nr:hypothetical protein BSKO_07434 [Bryopsis sp. KO-2023]